MGQVLLRTVALVGMMGAGKTAVGQALARRLNVAFRDSDAAIEAAADRTIAEIFARDGESFFRERETRVIARLLEESPGVLSTGGGAWMRAENRALISGRGVALWLKADLDVLWSRVRNREGRPLLQTPDPRATLAALCAARDPVYALADLTVVSEGEGSVEQMVDRVIAALRTRPDVLKES